MANQREPRVGRRPGNQDTRGQIITAARQAFDARVSRVRQCVGLQPKPGWMRRRSIAASRTKARAVR